MVKLRGLVLRKQRKHMRRWKEGVRQQNKIKLIITQLRRMKPKKTSGHLMSLYEGKLNPRVHPLEQIPKNSINTKAGRLSTRKRVESRGGISSSSKNSRTDSEKPKLVDLSDHERFKSRGYHPASTTNSETQSHKIEKIHPKKI
jgi:hypothetical protein